MNSRNPRVSRTGYGYICKGCDDIHTLDNWDDVTCIREEHGHCIFCEEPITPNMLVRVGYSPVMQLGGVVRELRKADADLERITNGIDKKADEDFLKACGIAAL